MPEEQADLPDPGAPDPSAGVRSEEVRRRLLAAMNDLPERHRLALTLRYMEGMDYRSIERAMGISNGAVRGLLARTLQTLRWVSRQRREAAAEALLGGPESERPAPELEGGAR